MDYKRVGMRIEDEEKEKWYELCLYIKGNFEHIFKIVLGVLPTTKNTLKLSWALRIFVFVNPSPAIKMTNELMNKLTN